MLLLDSRLYFNSTTCGYTTTRSGLQHAAIFSLPRGARRLGGAVMGAEEVRLQLHAH